MVRGAVALSFLLSAAPSAGSDIVFPADGGVIVVTAYGAMPNDGRDDTAAIRKALDEHPSGNHIVYFPNGHYLISQTLRPALDDGVTKRNIFQGQSREGTVLKLRDGLGHDDAVIDYRGGPAQFFRNAVRDLTIDIGRGNPKATGLKFNASNQGTVRNVTIRSADGAGRTGLDLRHSGEVGPLLVKDLLVVGFDVGIWSGWQTASQTFEDVTLRHQRTFGWVNEASQSVFAHRVRSVGEVPAIWNAQYQLPGDGQGKFLLVDAVLRGKGRASQVEAIRNGKAMYLRDVRAPGYKRVLTNAQRGFRGNGSVHGERIEEYWANGSAENRRGGPFQLFPSPDQSLRLAIEAAPAVPWESDLSRWAGPHHHGGTANDGEDDTAALQAAVDSGAGTVYLPRGRWRIDGTVVLRGAVERLLGTEAHVAGRGTVRIGPGRPEVVAIERLQGGGITWEHASGRTVIFRHLLGWTYKSSVEQPGDVFIEDVVGAPVVFRRQRVWARQLDIEGDIEDRDGVEAKLVNDGGSVWILGFKTEDDGTHIITRNGGETELLGALHVGAATQLPQYITEEARFAAAITNGGPGRVRETRQGTTRTGRIGHADLYTAFGFDAVDVIYVDNADEEGVEIAGEWKAVTSAPGGFCEGNLLRGSRKRARFVAFTAKVPRPGPYEVAARWINDISDPIAYATNARIDVVHAEGVETVRVNQRRGGGQWNALGVFPIEPRQPVKVIVRTDGANGHVQADAIRVRPAPSR
jgi:hypothetical protein